MLKRFSMAVARGKRSALPRLWLMTDSERMTDPARAVAALPPGSGVVLRHRDARQRRRLAEQLRPVCRRRRLVLLIAGDWRLAAALRCDGVHLPERMVAAGPAPGLRLWSRRAIVTAAAHSEIAMRLAQRLNVDAVMLAPVLATPSHPHARVLGRVGTAAMTKRACVPIVALGGLSARTLTQLNGIAFYGVAGVGFAAKKERFVGKN